MVKSLRLAWISKFLSDTNDSWKAIPNYYFSDYGGLQFLLKCNYNVNFINKNIPIFYRELLHYFCEIKNITNIFPHSEFPLWNNEAITIENNMLFWKSWFNRKVLFVLTCDQAFFFSGERESVAAPRVGGREKGEKNNA